MSGHGDALSRRFRTVRRTLHVGPRAIELLQPESAEDLIDEKDFERDERLPYWAELWPSAQVLAERVLELDGSGKRLLELGCGIGLVCAAAVLAGFDVLATDYYRDALRFTHANVWQNTGRDVDTRLLDWRRLPRPSVLGRFQYVVASDVLYERAYASLIAGALHATLAPGGTALVADPGRVAADDFLRQLGQRHLTLLSATPIAWTDGEVRQTITVYEVAAPR